MSYFHSPPSFQHCDLQPGTYFLIVKQSCFLSFPENFLPKNIPLFGVFLVFINFRMQVRPRCLFGSGMEDTHTHTAPAVHAEYIPPHIVVILVKQSWCSQTTTRHSQMKHCTGSGAPPYCSFTPINLCLNNHLYLLTFPPLGFSCK